MYVYIWRLANDLESDEPTPKTCVNRTEGKRIYGEMVRRNLLPLTKVRRFMRNQSCSDIKKTLNGFRPIINSRLFSRSWLFT